MFIHSVADLFQSKGSKYTSKIPERTSTEDLKYH